MNACCYTNGYCIVRRSSNANLCDWRYLFYATAVSLMFVCHLRLEMLTHMHLPLMSTVTPSTDFIVMYFTQTRLQISVGCITLQLKDGLSPLSCALIVRYALWLIGESRYPSIVRLHTTCKARDPAIVAV